MSKVRRGIVAFIVTSLVGCGWAVSPVAAIDAAPADATAAEVSVTKPPQRGVRPGRWSTVRLRLTNAGAAEVARVRVTGRGTDVFAGTVTLNEPLSVGQSAVVRLPVLLTVMAPRRFVVEALVSPGTATPIRRQIVIRPR